MASAVSPSQKPLRLIRAWAVAMMITLPVNSTWELLKEQTVAEIPSAAANFPAALQSHTALDSEGALRWPWGQARLWVS
ncbi:hypothetical protein BDV18DRAFT_140710 [Aspergillus unguis]